MTATIPTGLISAKKTKEWMTIVTDSDVYRMRRAEDMCSITVNNTRTVSVSLTGEDWWSALSQGECGEVIEAMTNRLVSIWSDVGVVLTDIIIQPFSFWFYSLSFLLMPTWEDVWGLGADTVIYPDGYAMIYDHAFAVNRYARPKQEFSFMDLMVLRKIVTKMSEAGVVEKYVRFFQREVEGMHNG